MCQLTVKSAGSATAAQAAPPRVVCTRVPVAMRAGPTYSSRSGLPRVQSAPCGVRTARTKGGGASVGAAAAVTRCERTQPRSPAPLVKSATTRIHPGRRSILVERDGHPVRGVEAHGGPFARPARQPDVVPDRSQPHAARVPARRLLAALAVAHRHGVAGEVHPAQPHAVVDLHPDHQLVGVGPFAHVLHVDARGQPEHPVRRSGRPSDGPRDGRVRPAGEAHRRQHAHVAVGVSLAGAHRHGEIRHRQRAQPCALHPHPQALDGRDAAHLALRASGSGEGEDGKDERERTSHEGNDNCAGGGRASAASRGVGGGRSSRDARMEDASGASGGRPSRDARMEDARMEDAAGAAGPRYAGVHADAQAPDGGAGADPRRRMRRRVGRRRVDRRR